jgi:hypothetical protein
MRVDAGGAAARGQPQGRLDLAVAIWISGFGGGLLVAEALRSVL